ncbi:hypothetical protein [Streptomyces aureoverticillatus]|uniref:hypothetical protein n=1 Tax=Streptomyces aureoverticillatus TaxID=66871 RepID=UPI0013D977C6|nr:hypothetical protein [Streptomyces aureoverticillatus]QIB44951.1 hypothetical protein G3H79_19640 [Streptomyces aureoverticillatus]
MIWWLRVRAVPALVVSLTVVCCVAALAPRSEVPVPSVVDGLATGLPFRYLVPLLPALLVLHGRARADRLSESVAARSVRLLDAGIAVGAVGVLLLSSTVVPDSVALARNLAGYLGVALILNWLSTPRLASAVTAFLPFAAASLGGGARPAWWAWPLHDGGSPLAATGAATLFVAGLALSFCPPLLGVGHDPDGDG